MSATPIDIKSLIEQLKHKSSPKRRTAAKKLRKLKVKEAGPALVDALKNEFKDKRTWETQYQMIMALGESGYTDRLDFLIQLAEKEFEATMVYVAIGHAVTALDNVSESLFVPLTKWIEKDKKELVEGCLRFLAMSHTTPTDDQIQQIIQYVSLPKNRDIQFWAIAAAPGWPKQLTTNFLEQAIELAHTEEIKKAAISAINGKYLKWNPL